MSEKSCLSLPVGYSKKFCCAAEDIPCGVRTAPFPISIILSHLDSHTVTFPLQVCLHFAVVLILFY